MNERDFPTIKLGGAMICSENIDLEKWTHDQVETSRYLEVRNERLVQRKELEIWLWIQRRKKTLELRKRRNSLKEMCKEKRTKSPGLGNFLPLFHSSQVHHVLCAVEYESQLCTFIGDQLRAHFHQNYTAFSYTVIVSSKVTL